MVPFMIQEMQTILHSRGVRQPHLLGRKHICGIIQGNGSSVLMDVLHPRPVGEQPPAPIGEF